MDLSLVQFLESTGWSADDLLKKLQKIKSTENPSSTPASSIDQEECIVDSTTSKMEDLMDEESLEKEKEIVTEKGNVPKVNIPKITSTLFKKINQDIKKTKEIWDKTKSGAEIVIDNEMDYEDDDSDLPPRTVLYKKDPVIFSDHPKTLNITKQSKPIVLQNKPSSVPLKTNRSLLKTPLIMISKTEDEVGSPQINIINKEIRSAFEAQNISLIENIDLEKNENDTLSEDSSETSEESMEFNKIPFRQISKPTILKRAKLKTKEPVKHPNETGKSIKELKTTLLNNVPKCSTVETISIEDYKQVQSQLKKSKIASQNASDSKIFDSSSNVINVEEYPMFSPDSSNCSGNSKIFNATDIIQSISVIDYKESMFKENQTATNTIPKLFNSSSSMINIEEYPNSHDKPTNVAKIFHWLSNNETINVEDYKKVMNNKKEMSSCSNQPEKIFNMTGSNCPLGEELLCINEKGNAIENDEICRIVPIITKDNIENKEESMEAMNEEEKMEQNESDDDCIEIIEDDDEDLEPLQVEYSKEDLEGLIEEISDDEDEVKFVDEYSTNDCENNENSLKDISKGSSENEHKNSQDIIMTDNNDADYLIDNREEEETTELKQVDLKPEESENEEEEINEHTGKSVDDIRNNLKLQLLNLRTRKKSFIQEVTTKVLEPATEVSKITEEKGKDEKVLAQTHEFCFIASVQGGVEIIEENETPIPDEKNVTANQPKVKPTSSSSSSDSSEDKPSVFEEIRKIIGRKNKRKQTFFPSSKKSMQANKIIKLDVPKTKPPVKSLGLDPSSLVTKEGTTTLNPFVSNELDQFLTADSELNISYHVPKSGAEEGLKKTIRAKTPDIFDKLYEQEKREIKDEVKKEESSKKIKAKTLAEKRKLLEKQQGYAFKKPEIKKDTIKKTDFVKKPETISVAPKDDENDNGDDLLMPLLTKRKTKPVKYKDYLDIDEPPPKLKKISSRANYVKYCNQKIFVTSTSLKTCVGVIKPDITRIRPKYKEFISKTSPVCNVSRESPVTSPVSNKLSLLKCSNKDPTAINYKPGPLCKKEKLLIDGKYNYETDILKIPKVTMEIMPEFRKPIDPNIIHLLPQFDGQIGDFQLEFALTALKPIRKEINIFGIELPFQHKQDRVLITRPKRFEKPIEFSETEKPDQEIVSDVINKLLNYVETKFVEDSLLKYDDTCKSDPDILLDKSPRKRPPVKKDRITMELSRLSCKVVSVDLEEEERDQICNKSTCAMGCVCKSLNCDVIVPTHCGKVKCMFKCNCPKFRHNNSDSTFSKILTDDAMSRINENAKKYLAKEEKEFTQTIIHTTNSVLMLGGEKPRRATKAPKKFDDFIVIPKDEKDIIDDPESTNTHIVSDEGYPKILSHIAIKSECYLELNKLKLDKIVPYCLVHNNHSCYCDGNDLIKPVTSLYTYPRYTGASRFISGTKYVKRNKSKSYVPKKILVPTHFMNNSPTIDFYTDGHEKPEITDSEALKQYISVSELEISEQVVKPEMSSKMKHVEKAMQRRKKKSVNISDIEHVKNGEITDTRHMHMSIKMDASGFSRLLPWTSLIKKFNSNQIKIWSMIDQPFRLLINTADKLPPKNYVDIRTSSSRSEVINWIINNNLPKDYDENTLYFILRETKDHFEVCGVCTRRKKLFDDNNQPSLLKKTDSEVVSLDSSDSDSTSVSFNNQLEFNQSLNVYDLFPHRNKENVTDTMFLSKHQFSFQSFEHIDEERTDVSAFLPDITLICKWRMIYLKSDFTFLNFSNNFSIRYMNLANIATRAFNSKTSLVLQSPSLSSGFNHRWFGLYFSKNLRNRFFVGPYFLNEGHNFETLRFVNKSLIDSGMYNLMHGIPNEPNSFWLRQTANGRPRYLSGNRIIISQKNSPTVPCAKKTAFIRLTKEDLEQKSAEIVPIVPEKSYLTYLDESSLVIIDSEAKLPEQFNRYIITNIPGFGYIGATQHEDSQMLDVSWPFENKLIRFQHSLHAKEFLLHRFKTLLQLFPVSFDLKLCILKELDTKKFSPIDVSHLNGHFICGAFGILNVKTLTQEVAMQKLGISRDEVIETLALKARLIAKQRVQCFAKQAQLFETDEELNQADLATIISKGAQLVKELQLKEISLQQEKRTLTTIKDQLKTELIGAIGNLSHEEQVEQYEALLNIDTCKISKNTIEIQDSDEESAKIVEAQVARIQTTQPKCGSLMSLLKPKEDIPGPVIDINSLSKELFDKIQAAEKGEASNKINFQKTTKFKCIQNGKGELFLINETGNNATRIVIQNKENEHVPKKGELISISDMAKNAKNIVLQDSEVKLAI